MDERQVEIRAWLSGLPGPIVAATYDECLAKAHKASGIDCDAATFERLLADAGYRPDHRTNHGDGTTNWCLPLPERQHDGGGGRLMPWQRRPSRSVHEG